jgi:hypothetical protein
MAKEEEELGKTGQKCLVCYEELETKCGKEIFTTLNAPPVVLSTSILEVNLVATPNKSVWQYHFKNCHLIINCLLLTVATVYVCEVVGK